MGIGENFTIIDTPGFSDTDGEDSQLIDDLVNYLKNDLKTTNAFLLLLKGTEDRFNSMLQRMLREFEIMFGEDFWNHVIIGFSFWPFRQSDIEDRIDE